MRLCIADPPYLGRARRWYGDGRGHGGGQGKADEHPQAGEWDKPSTHVALVERLNTEFDAWAVAMSVHSIGVYASTVDVGSETGYRFGAWVNRRVTPSGSRIGTSWEPVLFYVPRERRKWGSGPTVNDHVIASAGGQGFVGAKPRAWTRWVLDVLGYDADQDTVEDLFHGSGSVAREVAQGVLL